MCGIVGAVAHGGVAQIGQVIRLGAARQGGVLHFDEVADVHVGAQLGARPQAGERTDDAFLPNFGAVQHAVRQQLGARANLAILDHAVGSDLYAIA